MAESDHRPLPLVSVGIPTYNRRNLLEHTLKSVLEQQYPRLEIIISDNASTDETEKFCRAWEARDSRIRYIRHPKNLGSTLNFIKTLEAADGEYFMWLADDDWIEPGYIEHCARILEENPDCCLAGGKSDYYHDGVMVRAGEDILITQEDSADRVVEFCSKVMHNAVFYGLMRREILRKIPFLRTWGNDQILMTGVAYCGKIITQDGPRMGRRLGGISAKPSEVLADANMPAIWTFFACFLSYKQLVRQCWSIIWEFKIYRDRSFLSRCVLAGRVSLAQFRRTEISPVMALIQKARNVLLIRKRMEKLTRHFKLHGDSDFRSR